MDDKLNGADIKTAFRGWDISKVTNEYGEFWVISDGMREYRYSLENYQTKDDAWTKWENTLM